MTIYDQEYWLSCAEHQLPEEAAKDFGVAAPVMDHELQLAIGADGRQHLNRHALAARVRQFSAGEGPYGQWNQ